MLYNATRGSEQSYQLQQEPAHGPPLRGPLLAHGGLGNLFREWNDFPSALVHLEAGLQLDRYVGGSLPMAWAVHLPLARVYLAQGKHSARSSGM